MKRILLTAVTVVGLAGAAGADEPPSPAAILAEAIATAKTVPDADDRAEALVSIATAQAMVGDWQAARMTLQEISAADKSSFSDDALKKIVGLQAGSWIEAIGKETLAGVKRFMEMYGLEGRSPEIVRIAVSTSDVEGAFATAGAIEDPEERLWALWYIVRPLIEAGRWWDLRRAIREALATVEKLQDAETRAEVLAIIAWVQVLAGDNPGAETNFAAASAIAWTLGDYHERAEALRYIAAARFATRDEGAAGEAARESIALATKGGWADTLRAIAAWQAETGDVDGALATARVIEDGDDRTRALIHVAAAQARAGNPAAEATLREAGAAAGNLLGPGFRSIISAALANPGRRQDILTAAAAMTDFEGFVGWDSMPMAFATAPAVAAAVEELVAVTITIDDDLEQLAFLWSIAQPLILAGNRSALAAPVREALRVDRGQLSSDRTVSVPLVIAWVQAAAGDAAGAAKTLNGVIAAIDAANNDPDGEWLGIIAAVQPRIGDTAAALATAGRIADAADRAATLGWIAAGAPFPGIFFW